MNIIDIIENKKNNKALSAREIQYFIKGVTSGDIADYQTAALLMAICINGMNEEETFELTRAMIQSGDTIDTSFAGGTVADKHSTGGVSDTVTPVIVPVLALSGLKVVKMSGRGLSHTGGTIDKLESIKDFNTQLTKEQIIQAVNKSGAVIIGQSQNLVPADKLLYAIRDVTATVDSIPLIASSIMSKKIASGSDIILLDVKYGSGAFMKDCERAEALAKCMVKIAVNFGKKCAALITSMQQPLTENIGCNLEMSSAADVLKGKINDLYIVSREICARIFMLDGQYGDIDDARRAFDGYIASGKALNKLKQIISCQDGDADMLEKLQPAQNFAAVYVKGSGYVSYIDAQAAGKALVELGGGRKKKGDPIDHSAGIKLNLRINDFVKEGDTAAVLYCDDKNKIERAKNIMDKCYTLSPQKAAPQKLIYAYVTDKDTIYY